MIIRNCTSPLTEVAIDPLKTETLFLLLISNLRKTIIREKPMWKIVRICPPEVLRRIYRPRHKSTGTIADNHIIFNEFMVNAALVAISLNLKEARTRRNQLLYDSTEASREWR